MTPSQEAREYPPLPEADAWPLGPAVPFFGPEKMRSYVDADRKARQQDALEYPPQEELSITLLANQHGCRRGDGAITFEQSDLLRFVRSVIDADRKARQQEARAWVDVLAERRRQVEAEGWTPEHDDQHTDCSLARAAACYATGSMDGWPWRKENFKDSGDGQYSENHRRMLVKAGALILAEIERLDRAAIAKGGPQP